MVLDVGSSDLSFGCKVWQLEFRVWGLGLGQGDSVGSGDSTVKGHAADIQKMLHVPNCPISWDLAYLPLSCPLYTYNPI